MAARSNAEFIRLMLKSLVRLVRLLIISRISLGINKASFLWQVTLTCPSTWFRGWRSSQGWSSTFSRASVSRARRNVQARTSHFDPSWAGQFFSGFNFHWIKQRWSLSTMVSNSHFRYTSSRLNTEVKLHLAKTARAWENVCDLLVLLVLVWRSVLLRREWAVVNLGHPLVKVCNAGVCLRY